MSSRSTELATRPMVPASQLLKGTKSISRFTGLSIRDINRLIQANEIPGIKVGGRFVTDADAVRKWWAARTIHKLLGE